MKKLLNIIFGWWFWITNRNDRLAQERLKICSTCQYRKQFLCGECGCVLQAKARITEELCPRKKWPTTIITESIRRHIDANSGSVHFGSNWFK